jgi:hypothetical protein
MITLTDGMAASFWWVYNRLLEENVTLSDDVSWGFSDDEYFTTKIVNNGPPLWLLIIGAVLTAVVGIVLGFVLAMRTSKRFNRRIRSTALFKPLAKSSNKLIRSSLALDDLGYEEIADLSDIGRESSVPAF